MIAFHVIRSIHAVAKDLGKQGPDVLMKFSEANGSLIHYLDTSDHRSVVYSTRPSDPED